MAHVAIAAAAAAAAAAALELEGSAATAPICASAGRSGDSRVDCVVLWAAYSTRFRISQLFACLDAGLTCLCGTRSGWCQPSSSTTKEPW